MNSPTYSQAFHKATNTIEKKNIFKQTYERDNSFLKYILRHIPATKNIRK